MSEELAGRRPSGRAMKPQTAARKLGVYLPATPQEFQDNAVTHAELRELQHNPPQWLTELREKGPHPRPVVAAKLGVTIAALKRHDSAGPLTTAEIEALLADQPAWLRAEREAARGEGEAKEEAPADDAEAPAEED
ncbi:DUF5997 family protein [Corynebacterium frankenforstense]|uniref:DUF5997 family protein n=1 Tax=Corynebacterium frankenforstense TaxID=1230998 RepID=UPI0026F074C4|nr:DUF5997 family protein [Corynebacterium frankenforstense]